MTTRPRPEPLVYSPADAAAALGISVAKVNQLLQAGRLNGFKLDRLRRITRQELERFIEDCGGEL